MLTPRVLRPFLLVAVLLPACGGGDPVPAVAHHDVPAVAVPAPAPAAPIEIAAPVVIPVAPARVAPTDYADALARGTQLAAQGDTLGARELLEAAAALDRKAVAPHLELARLFIASGDRALAMTAARKAVQLAPASSAAWNTLGRAQLARFAYDDAVAAFTQATVLDATNAWAWNNLGFTQLAQKHYAEAQAALGRATSLPTSTGYMWNNLGTAYEQLGQLDEARVAFAAGGQLGSAPALASSKRLVGVPAIVAVGRAAPAPAATPEVHDYDSREPAVAADPVDAGVDVDAGSADVPAAPQTL